MYAHLSIAAIAILCVSGALACSTDDGDFCGQPNMKIPTMLTHGNKTYFFNNGKPVNFFNAMAECASYNMQLVTIDSNLEFLRINEFIKDNITPGITMNIWAGATDLATVNDFRWLSNGKKVDLDQWSTGQPDNTAGVERCLILGYYAVGMTKLYDLNCATLCQFICESKPLICYD